MAAGISASFDITSNDESATNSTIPKTECIDSTTSTYEQTGVRKDLHADGSRNRPDQTYSVCRTTTMAIQQSFAKAIPINNCVSSLATQRYN